MSAESIQALAERIKSDDALRERIQAADEAGREQILAEQGFSLSPDELGQVLSALNDGQLDDAVLESVTGGLYVPGAYSPQHGSPQGGSPQGGSPQNGPSQTIFYT